jgi:hypothetical protein
MTMTKNDVASEVARYFQAALTATPGEVREALRTSAPEVVRSLASFAINAAKSSDRKWAFTEFFSWIKTTILRDVQLQNSIANRNRRETELILARVKKLQATTAARESILAPRAEEKRLSRELQAVEKKLRAS